MWTLRGPAGMDSYATTRAVASGRSYAIMVLRCVKAAVGRSKQAMAVWREALSLTGCCLAKLACEHGVSEYAGATSRPTCSALRLIGPAGEAGAGGQGVGVLGAQDPLADRQQGGELVAGPGRIPRRPGPGGEVGAGGQGLGVLGAQDPLADGQQGGSLVAGPGRVP